MDFGSRDSSRSNRPLELSRRDSHESTERSGEVTRVLKAGLHGGVDDGVPHIPQLLLGSIDSPEQHEPVGRLAHALAEELRKVMWTHAGDRCELRKAEIFGEVVADIVQHST